MTSLFENLIDKPQRETSGPDTSSRFDYQKDWAFCKMLDLHIADEDYLVAFEFHDDVVFLDSENNPQNVGFYQVKTQKPATPKKLHTLLSVSKSKNSDGKSILGKLCGNILGICKTHSIQLFLVCNRPYQFSPTNICADALDDKSKKKIIEAIKAEVPDIEDNFLKKLFFYVTDVSVDEIETYLQGKTLNLFKKKFGENGPPIWGWIRLIQGEIKRKNNFPSDKITTVEELKKKKCLSKNFINNTLNEIAKKHTSAPDMQTVKSGLAAGGWQTADLMKLDKAFPTAVADYQDPTNNECITLTKSIEKVLEKLNLNEDLPKILESVYSELRVSIKIPKPYDDKIYLNALTLMIYNEKL